MQENALLRLISSRCRWVGVLAVLLWGVGGGNSTPVAHAQSGPALVKPTIFVGVWQSWHAWLPTLKKFQDNTTAWVPRVEFQVNGPVPSGSQFVVDFSKPNGAAWFSQDCPTGEIKADEHDKVVTPRDTSTAFEKTFTTGTGVFGFKIRLKNELSGQNTVLFTGKYKVGKVSKFNGAPVTKNKNDFYVDYDWALPIGYLYFRSTNLIPPLAAAMWFKGGINGSDLAGYIFYKGKQIGSTKDMGSAATTELDAQTYSGDKGDPQWQLCIMEWYTVAETENDANHTANVMHYLDKNPGEYEIKVLRDGKLCRDAKFTVGEDGKIEDKGIVAANALNTVRSVVPVKVLGTTDGAWNKLAWKTDAFYSHPLKGFAVP